MSIVCFVIFVEELMLLSTVLFHAIWQDIKTKRSKMQVARDAPKRPAETTMAQADRANRRRRRRNSPRSFSRLSPRRLEPNRRGEKLDLETRFLYDVIARDNERAVQNIDALDTGLIAIVVGILAVSLFAGDKFFELEPNFRSAGFFLLSESLAVCFGGYLAVYWTTGAQEVSIPEDFSIDFASAPVSATLEAIKGLTAAVGSNQKVRGIKRALVILGTLLVVAAGIVIIIGRARGRVP